MQAGLKSSIMCSWLLCLHQDLYANSSQAQDTTYLTLPLPLLVLQGCAACRPLQLHPYWMAPEALQAGLQHLYAQQTKWGKQ